MPWFDGIKQFLTAVETEYDRRIRTASNVKDYYPEGGGHGHGHHLSHDHDADHDHPPVKEEGGDNRTDGILQGAGAAH